MKPNSAKAKGRNCANEVKALIHQLFPELGEEDVIRTSGGQTGEDIVFSPRARGVLPISIEVKCQEALNIWKALQQAEDNSKDWQPVLIFRRNRSKLYACIEAAELLALLRIRAQYEKELCSEHDGPTNGSGVQ